MPVLRRPVETAHVFGNLEPGVLMCWIALYELVVKGEPRSKSVPQRLKPQCEGGTYGAEARG
jgi:hypothetical protein